MNNFTLPNLKKSNYQITSRLGINISGGRVTYKAIDLSTSRYVVIKQFSFLDNSWSGLDEIASTFYPIIYQLNPNLEGTKNGDI